jgi:hypothetical protein
MNDNAADNSSASSEMTTATDPSAHSQMRLSSSTTSKISASSSSLIHESASASNSKQLFGVAAGSTLYHPDDNKYVNRCDHAGRQREITAIRCFCNSNHLRFRIRTSHIDSFCPADVRTACGVPTGYERIDAAVEIHQRGECALVIRRLLDALEATDGPSTSDQAIDVTGDRVESGGEDAVADREGRDRVTGKEPGDRDPPRSGDLRELDCL